MSADHPATRVTIEEYRRDPKAALRSAFGGGAVEVVDGDRVVFAASTRPAPPCDCPEIVGLRESFATARHQALDEALARVHREMRRWWPGSTAMEALKDTAEHLRYLRDTPRSDRDDQT